MWILQRGEFRTGRVFYKRATLLSIKNLSLLGGRFPGPMAGDGASAAVSELWLPPAASGTGLEGQEQGERQGD